MDSPVVCKCACPKQMANGSWKERKRRPWPRGRTSVAILAANIEQPRRQNTRHTYLLFRPTCRGNLTLHVFKIWPTPSVESQRRMTLQLAATHSSLSSLGSRCRCLCSDLLCLIHLIRQWSDKTRCCRRCYS